MAITSEPAHNDRSTTVTVTGIAHARQENVFVSNSGEQFSQ